MINNDKELLNIICYTNSKRNKHNNCFRLKKEAVYNIYFKNKEVYDYIHNRYNNNITQNDDYNLFYEVVYRICNNIDEPPKCPYCGKQIPFYHKYKGYCYLKTCNNHDCVYKAIKEKRDKTIKEKYGVDNPYQLDWVKADIRKKLNERYGGFTMERSSSIYNKFKKTMIEKYGDENPMHSPECIKRLENTFLKKYGATNPWGNRKIWLKCLKTQNENKKGTLYSKEEDRIYEHLCSLYGKENVLRQYKSEVYPFNCDFYIKSIDTYMEYNGYWTHGSHPFNKNNIHDLIMKARIIKKYNNDPQWIWWTKDVEKINTAKRNKLNYVMWYNMKEFDDWYNNQIIYK